MGCDAPALSAILRPPAAHSLCPLRCRPTAPAADRSTRHQTTRRSSAYSHRHSALTQEASALHSSIHTPTAMTEFPDIVLSAGKSKVRSSRQTQPLPVGRCSRRRSVHSSLPLGCRIADSLRNRNR